MLDKRLSLDDYKTGDLVTYVGTTSVGLSGKVYRVQGHRGEHVTILNLDGTFIKKDNHQAFGAFARNLRKVTGLK